MVAGRGTILLLSIDPCGFLAPPYDFGADLDKSFMRLEGYLGMGFYDTTLFFSERDEA